MPKINIRPSSGVYATYKNLRYEPWTGLAEFVDNSTQSYFDNRTKLLKLPDFDKLIITINYCEDENGEDCIIIEDNAYGMELNDFERAIILDKPPVNHPQNSRNEFGMGLKTAACWFGSYWTVISKQYGSENVYSASVDVDKLSRDKDEEIELNIENGKIDEHYTIVKIQRLNKKITGSRTIGKVKSLLSNIYRNDLRSGEIEIRYKDESLSYKDPVVYEEELPDGSKKQWKKDVEFSITHGGKDLTVKGFVALRIPASRSEAGFTLLRRGRVIIGGPESNYRPIELFGDAGTYTYQRMFGELHMDNWPVTQAKDNFDWHTEGLEEKFISELEKFTKEFSDKAEKIRTRPKVKTSDTLEEVGKELEKTGAFKNVTVSPIFEQKEEETDDNTCENEESKKIEENQDFDITSNSQPGFILEGNNKAEIKFIYKNQNYRFVVVYDMSSPRANWLVVKAPTSNDIELTINMRHQFFYPLIDNPTFIKIITKFLIAFVLSQLEVSSESDDGRVDLSDVRIKMNEILEIIQYEKDDVDE